MDTDQTRALIDDFYATLARGDRAHLESLLAEDVEWQMPASVPNNIVSGRAAVADELGSATIRRLFRRGTFGMDVLRVLVDGAFAAVQTQTHALTQAGKLYEMQYCWVYTCRDGTIAHIREYLDTWAAARSLDWDLTANG